MTIIINDGELVSGDSDYYGLASDGDDYFNTRLNVDAWGCETDDNKIKSLYEATRLIDRLNFRGNKSDVSQNLQFPRGGDEEVPTDILQATYEIALKLLDGVDPDLESDDLRTTTQGYSTVRVSKDTGWGQEYLQAGIPSSRAWHLLKPYLRDPTVIKINRSN